jgi:sensor c-di-GMP phosphodiesterase-like protein
MTRRLKFRLLALLCALVALLPLALALWLSYVSTVRSIEADMRRFASAALVRSESMFDDAKTTLARVAKQTGGVCNPENIEFMSQQMYASLYMREIGVFDGDTLLCNDRGPFYPSVPIVIAEQRKLPEKPGEVHIVRPLQTLRGETNVIVNYRVRDELGMNALIDPKLFEEVLTFFQSGERSGVYLLHESGEPLVVLGTLNISNLPKAPGFGVTVVRQGRTIYAISRSQRYPIYSVISATSPWLMQRWQRDAVLSCVVGILLGVVLWYFALKLLRQAYSLDADLREALHNNELSMHYQRIVGLDSGATIGFEALMRWQHPESGLISADIFIPKAERSGFIVKLTDWALTQIKQDRESISQRYPNAYVAVNLSRSDLESDKLLSRIRSRLGEDLNGYLFEITEHELITDDSGRIRALLQALLDAGARVALDDFGSGYCGLAYLRQFPLSVLKIDRSFVRMLNTDDIATPLLKHIVAMADTLKLDIIAEGVETTAHVDCLLALGVKIGQGWYYARAKPLAEL